MPWNELSLHRWIERALGGAPRVASIGDDAAALVAALRRPVLCVDQLVVGVHVEPGTSPARAGRKACARALSDLAASAARPRAVLAAVRAPASARERDLRALLRGVDAAAREQRARLVGGDLCCAPGPLGVAVTALGELDAPRRVSRSAARPGDTLVVTGPCGGSRLGRHLRIAPRLAEGRWLARRGVRAMMDTSDGLGLDLARLARASRVRLEVSAVPVHRDARRAARADGRAALAHALADGEDHELIAAVPRAALAAVLREAPRRCPGLAVLGVVRAGAGLAVPAAEGATDLIEWRADSGWVHGG